MYVSEWEFGKCIVHLSSYNSITVISFCQAIFESLTFLIPLVNRIVGLLEKLKDEFLEGKISVFRTAIFC